MKKNLSLSICFCSLVALAGPAVLKAAGPWEKNHTIAVLPMIPKIEMGQAEALSLSMRLSKELDRTDLFYTLALSSVEQKLMTSDPGLLLCAEADCGVAAGQSLGVDFLINGVVEKVGSDYHISLRMIRMQDGNVVQTILTEFTGENGELHDYMESIAKSFVGIQIPGIETNVTLEKPERFVLTNQETIAPAPVVTTSPSRSKTWLYYSALVAGAAGIGMIMLNKMQ